MSQSLIPREALQAPLAQSHPQTGIDRALWLYVALLLAATPDGLVIRRIPHLAQELSVSEADVEHWLTRLSEAKLIRVVSPAPYLTVRLRFWPSSRARANEESPPGVGEAAAAQEEVPVGSSEAAAAIKQSGDRGQGEGAALLAEAREIIPDADSAELRILVLHHAPQAIRCALERVKATPAREIRKSRIALFRFLLTKITRTADVHDR